MYSASGSLLIDSLVASQHAHGILHYILGPTDMRRRVSVVAVRINNGDPSAPETFRAFVRSCYYDGDRRPQIPLVNKAIAFYVRPIYVRRNASTRSFLHTYPSDSGQQWFILDVETDDLSRVVPLGVYIPYCHQGPVRTTCVLDNIDPIPMWVVTNGILGVNCRSNKIGSIEHGDWQFNHPDGSAKTTVSVKIHWPGYARWDSQVRMKSDTYSPSRPGDSFTFARLVRQVICKIRKFISDHDNVASRNPHWTVGNAYPGRITVEDLVLLAIVVVSKGAVMPILKVRDDFVFSDSVPMQGIPSALATLEPSGVSTATTPATALPPGQTDFNAHGRTFDLGHFSHASLSYTDDHASGDVDSNHTHPNHRYSNSTVSPDVWW